MRLIHSMLLALLALGSNVVTVQAAAPGGQFNIGVQLWSVRGDIEEDFEGTLRKLADMGFDGVEFAGNYGPYADNPAALKSLLAQIGLAVAGAHVQTQELRGEQLPRTVAFHQQLGTPFLIVPYDRRAFDDEGVYELARELNEVDKQLAGTGLRVGYHNHAQEMGDYVGTTYWDVLASNTRDSVILQQDVGWTVYAGRDPVVYVNKYPGRTLTTHYKVRLPFWRIGGRPFVGEGKADWPAILRANRDVGGTLWYVVEQEDYPWLMSPMESVQTSLRGLQKVIGQVESE